MILICIVRLENPPSELDGRDAVHDHVRKKKGELQETAVV